MTDGLDYWAYGYYLVIIIWSELFQSSWDRENEAIKVKWGTDNFVEIEKDRPQFVGSGPLVRSNVDNQKMAVFPHEIRTLRVLGSYGIIIVLIILNLSLIGGIYIGEYILMDTFPTLSDPTQNVSWYMTYGQAALHAFVLQTNAVLFPKFVMGLNDYENYRTDTA
jgi:hypothetical protein